MPKNENGATSENNGNGKIYFINKETVLRKLDIRSYYDAELGSVKWNAVGQGLARCPFHEDTNPSLSVNSESGVFHCYGCLKEGDLFTFHMKRHRVDFSTALKEIAAKAGVENSTRRSGRTVAATYDYTDEQGKLLFQTVRFEPKSFAQRRPDGKGGWIWSLRGVEPVIYNLVQVVTADSITIVEGEKDVETLKTLGLVGTSCPLGANKWRSDYNRYFQDKYVMIVPDNDRAGKEHAVMVGAALSGVAACVKIVELQGLPDKGDVTDWVNGGGTKDELLRLAAEAPEWQQPPDLDLATEKTVMNYRPEDVGNSQRFVDLHGQNLLYCVGSWFSWSGKRWEEDKTLNIYRLASGMQDIVLREADEETDKKKQTALYKVGKSLGLKKTIDAMIGLSRHHVAVTQDVFDRDPYLLNVQNGTIDLRTGDLVPHCREDRITKIAGAAYDPAVACPRWLAFLDTIFDGRQDLIRFVQKAIGYSLTGDVGEQCFFILYGSGANGKSTLLDVVQSLLNDYSMHSRMETFLTKKAESIPNDVARLAGARFISAVEIDNGRRLSESTVKTMTGKDLQTARFLHKEFFTFKPQAKIFLAVNHRPEIRGTDYAIWRRVRLIPFTVQILEGQQNKHLAEEIILEEPSGVLNWALTGCLLWQKEGLEPVKDVREATELYRTDMDPLGPFIKERCVVGQGYIVVYARLYSEYCEWAKGCNEPQMTKRQFGDALTEKGFSPAYGTGHEAIRKEIGLLSDLSVTR